jgi:hypothetical protein
MAAPSEWCLWKGDSCDQKLPPSVLMEDVMIEIGDVAVGYGALFVLLVIILIVAAVRIVATFKILDQGHTCGKYVRGEHEEIPVIQ